MQEKPLYVCTGDSFQQIAVFTDKIILLGKKRIELEMKDIGCFKQCTCKDLSCRYWIDCSEFRNCVLNVDRPMTFDEIAKIMHVSRQAVHQSFEKRILKKFNKLYRKFTKAKCFEDTQPELPIPIIPNKEKDILYSDED